MFYFGVFSINKLNNFSLLWPIDTKLGACNQCNQNNGIIFSLLPSFISYSCHIKTWLNRWKPGFVVLRGFLFNLFPFLCPRHSKNGGGALSVTPVRVCVRACVRACERASVRPLSKFGVRLITFERLHRFNSNLVCWYIISKQVRFGLQSTNFWRSYGPFIKTKHKNWCPLNNFLKDCIDSIQIWYVDI